VSQLRRLSRIDLISADPGSLAGFYEALGFTRTGAARAGLGEETRLAMRLGAQRIDLVRPSRIGAPYPPSVPGWSQRFQHLAIVVSDMEGAHARLKARVGWTAISADGPQHLPETSGGATAFKFRDPEGHPLELIAFAPARTPDRWRRPANAGLFLGVDHSAISVAETRRSVDFYERLGLIPTGGSTNVGVEQARLDAIAAAHVEVTALSTPTHSTPHVELLCYRGAFVRDTDAPRPGDIAATRLVFEAESAQQGQELRPLMRDPDGHLIVLERVAAYSGST
jgi:catechol 2,3-dioxygenase-like lactoylglutathione lyase family enzyme